MRISDWSSDVCSSDLLDLARDDLLRPSCAVADRSCGDQGPGADAGRRAGARGPGRAHARANGAVCLRQNPSAVERDDCAGANPRRSEEHTSELQSLMRISYAVLCLKKKNKPSTINPRIKR